MPGPGRRSICQRATDLRLLLRQPALPHYRLPIFRRLAGREGVTLRVVTSVSESIDNVDPVGLDALTRLYQHRRLPVVGETYRDPELRAEVEAFGPDVVILPWNARQADLPAHLDWLRSRGVGSVLWGHGYSKREKPWRRWLRNRVARRADALLFYNHAAAERCRGEGLDPRRVFIAPNALDHTEHDTAHAHWRANADGLERLAERHGLAGRQNILFVSRMDPANRLDLLVRSLPIVAAQVADVQVVAVGRGETEISALQALAESLGVAERVRFLGPIYDQRELGGIMCLGAVFCYPANIGLSILHAFAFGLPVVTSDDTATHNPEIESLRPGENGLTYRDGDAAHLSAELVRVLTDAPLRERLARGARDTVAKQYHPEVMVDGLVAACRHAASTVGPKKI